jgi:hypothetical protein
MWIDESYKTVNMVDRILTDYGYVCDFTSRNRRSVELHNAAVPEG